MHNDEIRQVRQFNRTVTQRIGALSDQYLARGRPLGASRVLWEIGPRGADVRTVRERLGLDSGYLSRLLRNLEAERLVTVVPDDIDQRLRVIRPTDAGLVELAELDRRSDELAASLLASLDGEQRHRLLEAMQTIDRLLTAGLVEIRVEDPTGQAASYCIQSYFVELNSRFETGFDPARSIPADATELTEPNGLLLVAFLRGEPMGCGGLKFHGDDPTEIKRMWVATDARGLGVGRRLLTELEQQARARGVGTVRLETNRTLIEAINMYRSAGYVEVARFNDEPYADHWFEKRL